MFAEGGWAIWLILAWLALIPVGIAATAWLLVRVWKRRRQTGVATHVIAMLAATSALLGGFGTFVGLVKAFGAVGGESVDPSQKARILAEGISEAINCTAFGMLTWLPCVAATLLLLRKH